MAVVSKIKSAIPPQNFETIRDRIAEILLVEFTAQIGFQTDPETKKLIQKTKLFSELFRPFNEAEFFAIDIFLFTGDYDNKTQTSVRGNYTFYLDFYGRAATTNQNEGDKRSAEKVQRLIGITRAILESPNWLTLGFTPPGQFVQRTEVKSLKRTEERNNHDVGNIIFYRMVFDVIGGEDTDTISGVLLKESFTTVEIAETGLGYEYKFPPDPNP